MDAKIRDKIVDTIVYSYLNNGCSNDEYLEMLTAMQELYSPDDSSPAALRIDVIIRAENNRRRL